MKYVVRSRSIPNELCCYSKRISSEKGILARLGLEPTSPSSQEEIAGALNHSTTTICLEMELNNRIYINLRLATTPKELEIHHGNFL